MASDETVTKLCFCQERIDAMASGLFRYSHSWGGWWFVDMPTRVMSSHARYYAFHERAEFPHSDHSGEPFIHVECPYCGASLPGVRDDQRPFGQADGATGEPLP